MHLTAVGEQFAPGDEAGCGGGQEQNRGCHLGRVPDPPEGGRISHLIEESRRGGLVPDVPAKVRAEGLSFAQAAQLGAMVEPGLGEPEMPPLLADLAALGVPLTAIVEHDIYPAPAGVPLPTATRNQR